MYGMPANLVSQAQHQHLPAGQPRLLPCQLNFLLLYLIPWCYVHLSKQINGQINVPVPLLSFLLYHHVFGI